MANYIARPKNLVASSVMTAIKEAYGYNDEDFYNHFSMPTAMIHFHGGDNPEIAWNDVQAIQSINKYNENIKKIPVPSYPTEGYNQHSHTSEYDGGVITGMLGVHNHKSNKSADGGLAFAIFAPSTMYVLDWQ